MSSYDKLKKTLIASPRVWLITGVAGFIGSNLLEALLSLNQKVVGLDNFSTGYMKNLNEVKLKVSHDQWANFIFHVGDVRNLNDCHKICCGVDYVLHQAAIGSVPKSILDPLATNDTNVNGFLNMLVASKDANVKSFTYAASSSTYGDHQGLPKIESRIGNPLSPYAVTKYVNELYADVFFRCYSFKSIGLRYFNVFGARQSPDGAYAAVIPKWIAAMLSGDPIFINGDGETSRDFCYVKNVVQANLLAATVENIAAQNQIFNVAVGHRASLNELFLILSRAIKSKGVDVCVEPTYRDFRVGDVMHSQADISKARNLLGYLPTFDLRAGVEESLSWYLSRKT